MFPDAFFVSPKGDIKDLAGAGGAFSAISRQFPPKNRHPSVADARRLG
jgi:hypothetical protein